MRHHRTERDGQAQDGTTPAAATDAGPGTDRETDVQQRRKGRAAPDDVVPEQPVDDRRVRGTYTNGAHTVTAELTFNDDHQLVDFVSDDRLRSSPDGRTFTPQRWSTPISDYRTLGSRRLGTSREGRRHAPEPEGEFVYLEFHVDEITYNAGTPETGPARDGNGVSTARRPAASPA